MPKNRFQKVADGEYVEGLGCRSTMSNGMPCVRKLWASNLCYMHFKKFVGHEFGHTCKTCGVCGSVAANSFSFSADPCHVSNDDEIECYHCGKRAIHFWDDDSLFQEPCAFKQEVTAKMEIPNSVVESLLRLILADAGLKEPFYIRKNQDGFICWTEGQHDTVKRMIEEEKWLKIARNRLVMVRKWLRQPSLEVQSTQPMESGQPMISQT